MKRLAIASLVGACAITACQEPALFAPGEGPVLAISDGAHGGGTGNPDFFFLPSMVSNPSGSPNFEPAEFNPNLQPEVQICHSTGEAFGVRCVATQVALFTFTSGPGGETVGVVLQEQQYHVNWQTKDFGLTTGDTYRVRVFVGTHELGFADVLIMAGGAKNAKTAEDIPLKDGSTLAIKFRIENAAVCYAIDPGFRQTDPTEPCASATLGTGGSVTLESAANEVLGITHVRPRGGSTSNVSTITMKKCASLNPTYIDLPTYSDCLDIESDPPLSPENGLVGVALMCQAVTNTASLSPEQLKRVTVLNLRDNGDIVALPDADGECPVLPAPAPARIGLSPFDRLLRLARATWAVARDHVVAWLGPQSLWASLVCDRGGCGGWDFESPVQAALPAKMEYDDAADASRTLFAGESVPMRVFVSDKAGEAVQGARVHFEILEGGVGQLSETSDLSDANGIAEVTLMSGAGHTVVRASGRGIADPSATPCNETESLSEACTVSGVFAPDHELGENADPVVVGEGHLDFEVESRIIVAASGQGTGGGPSDLYLVEAFATGSDVHVAELHTSPATPGLVITDIAKSPTTGQFFAISFTTLYTVDLSTALLTPVGSLGLSNANALAFDNAGALFGMTTDGEFVSVNTTTAAATAIGSLGAGLASQGDIAFGPDGTLFGTANSSTVDGLVSVLVVIDPTTGAATVQGAIGFPNAYGLAFLGNQLYGLTAGPGNLITIDQSTGAGAAVRGLSFDTFGASSATK